jgi:hypothetical protein
MGIVMQLLIERANFRITSPREWLARKETSAEHLIAAGTVVNCAAASSPACRNNSRFVEHQQAQTIWQNGGSISHTHSASKLIWPKKWGGMAFIIPPPSCEPNLN